MDVELRKSERRFEETGDVCAYVLALQRAGKELHDICLKTHGSVLSILHEKPLCFPDLVSERDALVNGLLSEAEESNDSRSDTLARCYAALGRTDDVERIIASSPSFIDFHFVANDAAEQGLFDQAGTWAKRARHLRGEARAYIAENAAEQGAWSLAKQSASHAGRQRGYAWANLAIQAAKQSLWADAFTYLKRTDNPDSAISRIAWRLGSQQDWKTAEQLATKIRNSHEQTWAYIWMAQEAARQGLWEKAETYKRPGVISEDWSNSHMAVGAAQRGVWDQALTYRARAGIRVSETDAELCPIAASQGDWKRANDLVPSHAYDRNAAFLKLALIAPNRQYALDAGDNRDWGLGLYSAEMTRRGNIDEALASLALVASSRTQANCLVVRALHGLRVSA